MLRGVSASRSKAFGFRGLWSGASKFPHPSRIAMVSDHFRFFRDIDYSAFQAVLPTSVVVLFPDIYPRIP
ncbi:hypothetical protein HPB47_007962 [Ixodes persulcatus]|uniref:Uncharacterized protein n=1 Tax=Ixodes persulcatus TaxID=34615 RepID=A0AC60P607_IXOPE|nr:hypothetical protein HPB47_007962 [Ixodes persulcatus]